MRTYWRENQLEAWWSLGAPASSSAMNARRGVEVFTMNMEGPGSEDAHHRKGAELRRNPVSMSIKVRLTLYRIFSLTKK